MTENPIDRFVSHQGVAILDGGLATTLEAQGCSLEDDLWSAKILLESPEIIRRVHIDFLTAGADCITTSTYQATIQGFQKRGMSRTEAIELLRQSVGLAVEARDQFWSDPANQTGRLRPFVGASVGPYGAFLADGSEYTGNYDIDDKELYLFHKERWDLLVESAADILACETIPSQREALVLLKLLRETPQRWAWLSFSCRDGSHLNDGSAIGEVAGHCDAQPNIAAVGINCTSPEFIPSLIQAVRKATTKPVIVYPNSGETFDARRKTWDGARPSIDWEAEPIEWVRLGAAGVGGCCRVGLEEVATIRRSLVRAA